MECLCKCLKNLPALISVNLTATGLTWKSADILAKLVKVHIGPVHKEANHVPKAVLDRDPIPDWVPFVN